MARAAENAVGAGLLLNAFAAAFVVPEPFLSSLLFSLLLDATAVYYTILLYIDCYTSITLASYIPLHYYTTHRKSIMSDHNHSQPKSQDDPNLSTTVMPSQEGKQVNNYGLPGIQIPTDKKVLESVFTQVRNVDPKSLNQDKEKDEEEEKEKKKKKEE